MTAANPIICALDTPDVMRAAALAHALSGSIGAIKLGLEFFTANGAAGVRQLEVSGLPVFLDLKFHDIPNTVAKAIAATAGMRTFMMTVHASGGRDMLKAAVESAQDVAVVTGQERPLIIGVTVLTSLDQADLAGIGVGSAVDRQVKRLADLAMEAGLDGVVCSPHEIEMLRRHAGNALTLVVPGIRPAGSGKGDQKRTLTPKEAVDKGADYLVIGRPITGAADPKLAAGEILRGLS